MAGQPPAWWPPGPASEEQPIVDGGGGGGGPTASSPPVHLAPADPHLEQRRWIKMAPARRGEREGGRADGVR